MFLDTRLGNSPRWLLKEPKGWGMRVPEEVRKSVIYLGRLVDEGSQRRLHFCGTGFIVSIDSAKDYGQKRQYLHLVTARHVVDQLKLGKWVMRLTESSIDKDTLMQPPGGRLLR